MLPLEETLIPRVRTRQRRTGVAADPVFDEALAQFALQIVERKLSELTPSPRNARTHSCKQVHQIAQSIKAFGFVTPILVDPAGEIVAG